MVCFPLDKSQYQGCLRRVLGFLAAAFLAILPLGCSEVKEEIRVYRVPKTPQKRILAAMVPHQDKIWIFKVSGSDRKVAAFEREFEAFLQTVRFDASRDASPKWELTEDWKQLPADHPSNSGPFPRFATVYKPDKELVERMEIAISSLPRRGGDPWEFDVKRNVIRWRGQLGLPEVPIAQLDEYISEIKLENGPTATLIKLFEGEEPPAKPATVAAAVDRVPFDYEKPDAWPLGPDIPFSLLGFQVTDGDETVVISVTPAGGGLLPNVNRWRAQVKLQPIEQDELDKQIKKLEAGDVTFDYIQLVGAERSILAAVGTNKGQMWFVTLKGDKQLAARETENFEKFVKSMRFKS